jgi:hypothetical protein
VVVITAGIDHEELGMKRLIAAAAGALLLAVAQPAGAATVTRATSVGVHNSYSQDEFAHLADALDTGADLIEVDVWSNFLGSGDFQVGHDPGNANNCTAATTYPQLRTGSRDQNLAACLRNVRIWHDHNPNHPPVVLKLEFKNGFDDTHGYGPDEFDRLLNSTIGAGRSSGRRSCSADARPWTRPRVRERGRHAPRSPASSWSWWSAAPSRRGIPSTVVTRTWSTPTA